MMYPEKTGWFSAGPPTQIHSTAVPRHRSKGLGAVGELRFGESFAVIVLDATGHMQQVPGRPGPWDPVVIVEHCTLVNVVKSGLNLG